MNKESRLYLATRALIDIPDAKFMVAAHCPAEARDRVIKYLEKRKIARFYKFKCNKSIVRQINSNMGIKLIKDKVIFLPLP